MKKKILISFLALCLISVALVVFFLRTTEENIPLPPAPAPSEDKVENAEPGKIEAISKNYGEASEKYKYQISFNYPFFESLNGEKNLDGINNQIEKNVQVEVDKYIAEARKNKIAPIFGYLIGKYEYSIEPDKTLSVKIEMEKILSGAASSQNLQVIWNYDLESGKQIPPRT